MQKYPRSESLEGLLKELPPELQEEVKDFAEFLLERRRRKGSGPLRQDWAGALKAYSKQFTALALQQKALDWRGDQPCTWWIYPDSRQLRYGLRPNGDGQEDPSADASITAHPIWR